MNSRLEGGGVAAVVEMGRISMLMLPVARALNDLTIVAPTRRVLSVAAVLNEASEQSDQIARLMNEFGVVDCLREEGRARGTGEVVVPKAFVVDFDRGQPREGSGANA